MGTYKQKYYYEVGMSDKRNRWIVRTYRYTPEWDDKYIKRDPYSFYSKIKAQALARALNFSLKLIRDKFKEHYD